MRTGKWFTAALAAALTLAAPAAAEEADIVLLPQTEAATGAEEGTEAETEADGGSVSDMFSEDRVRTTAVTMAESMEEVFRALSEVYQYTDYAFEEDVLYAGASDDAAIPENSLSEGASTAETSAAAEAYSGAAVTDGAGEIAWQEDAAETAAESGDYSQVNTREADVDEGDIVRTDGEYIYSLQGDDTLYILTAGGADTETVSETQIVAPEEFLREYRASGHDIFAEITEDGLTVSLQAEEVYVTGDTLCVAVQADLSYDNLSYEDYRAWCREQRESGDAETDGAAESGAADTETSAATGALADGSWSSYWRGAYANMTALVVYDISDRTKPVRTGCVMADGRYEESRRIGDVVWLYTEKDPFIGPSLAASDLSVRVGGEAVPAERYCLPETVTGTSFLVASSVDLTDPAGAADAAVFVSGSALYYATTESLYIVNSDYAGTSERSEIIRFRLDGAQIEPVAAARLRGYINDSFSLDEYGGHLRVLTTYTGSTASDVLTALADLFDVWYYAEDTWTRHNALFILDSDMQKVSSLKGIAENEEIRSARFFGDTVYFVTFENTDPLFTADLSDPANPVLTGELEITGFSSYLHPWTDGRLLGMGYEADEDGTVTGVKLSMFDITDPAHVTEVSRTVLDNVTWCPSLENYKSILADSRKNVIGFYLDNRYLVYAYSEEAGFTRELLYDLFEDGLNGNDANYRRIRGLYAGSDFYVSGDGFLTVFDMKADFGKLKVAELAATE